MSRETVDAIVVDLEVESERALFILLHRDGSINRTGTGSFPIQDHDMYIGLTKGELFAQLLVEVDDGWFSHQGTYDIPDKVGKECLLSILMWHSDGAVSGFKFRYGSESEGPPGDICEFVSKAVRITDPWFNVVRGFSGGTTAKRKPWWKFW